LLKSPRFVHCDATGASSSRFRQAEWFFWVLLGPPWRSGVLAKSAAAYLARHGWPSRIEQFDAICFLNTVGVLFDDPELRKSLLGFIAGGKGFAGIHDAIATFVQYPKYDQWPPFGQMLGATENGGHPWEGETMTVKIEIPKAW
jgi:hypothetical protein